MGRPVGSGQDGFFQAFGQGEYQVAVGLQPVDGEPREVNVPSAVGQEIAITFATDGYGAVFGLELLQGYVPVAI